MAKESSHAKIIIGPPKNITAERSIFVTFRYNPQIVMVLKSHSPRFYDQENKVWELSAEALPAIRNYLEACGITCDVVDMYDQRDKRQALISENVYGFPFKTKPYRHQVEAFNFGITHDKWFLGDDQGCVSGECKVQIKEPHAVATRRVKVKDLNRLMKNEAGIQIKTLINGRFGYLPIKKVVDKGIQETIRITLEDTWLVCTKDHLIYTENGWVEAGTLKSGDKVFTNGLEACPVCGSTENLITYPYAKFRGYCRSCMYKARNGTKYNELVKKIDKNGYVRLFGKETRNMPTYNRQYGLGVYEHHQVWYENTGHVVDTTKEAIHHINGIKTDNRFENLQLVTLAEHEKLHEATYTKHLYQFNENLEYVERKGTKIYLVPKLEAVTSVAEDSTQHVWDIAIDSPDIHNFICNNVIVHNCGKSKMVTDIAVGRKKWLKYPHCLIICGVNGLKWNWLNEIRIHSDEKGYIIGQHVNAKTGKITIGTTGDKLADLERLLKDPYSIEEYFLITNMETLRGKGIAEAINHLCEKNVIGMVAFDEFHKVKNINSQACKALMEINCPCKIAMTGTPLMNNPMDLYPLLTWLGYEHRNYWAFRNHYCVLGGFKDKQIVDYWNMDELTDRMHEIMLRRLKTDVLDLPEKIYMTEYVEMSKTQRGVYDSVRTELLKQVEAIAGRPNPLQELIKLRQATGYTGLVTGVAGESAKLDRMEELVDEAVANGSKVIIFSVWAAMADIIFNRLGAKYKGCRITGSVKEADRNEAIRRFQNMDEYKFITGTVGAMGTGLTLTAANTVIFVDEPWTYADKMQAVDRAHRVGQKNTVCVYTLVSKDTIDEKINAIVEAKGDFFRYMVDSKAQKVAFLKKLIGG